MFSINCDATMLQNIVYTDKILLYFNEQKVFYRHTAIDEYQFDILNTIYRYDFFISDRYSTHTGHP